MTARQNVGTDHLAAVVDLLMEHNSELENAIVIALMAHAGQIDKGWQPYILHPLRVMMALENDDERIVGVLHDVIEDSDWQPEHLLAFGREIVDALVAITRKPGESYEKFIRRCKRNPLARKVKIADLADNLHPSRAENISAEQRHRYLRAHLELLLDR